MIIFEDGPEKKSNMEEGDTRIGTEGDGGCTDLDIEVETGESLLTPFFRRVTW